MYETRWPRPGPALLAVGTVFGLIVGGILGISFPASSSDQPEATTTLTAPQTTAPVPANFYTVVLASPSSIQDARARVVQLRSQGITHAVVLAKTEYPALGRPYAVCAGTYPTRGQAGQALQELNAQHPGLSPPPYVRQMRRAT